LSSKTQRSLVDDCCDRAEDINDRPDHQRAIMAMTATTMPKTPVNVVDDISRDGEITWIDTVIT